MYSARFSRRDSSRMRTLSSMLKPECLQDRRLRAKSGRHRSPPSCPRVVPAARPTVRADPVRAGAAREYRAGCHGARKALADPGRLPGPARTEQKDWTLGWSQQFRIHTRRYYAKLADLQDAFRDRRWSRRVGDRGETIARSMTGPQCPLDDRRRPAIDRR